MLKATLRSACPLLLLMLANIAPTMANTEEDGRYWLSVYAQGKLPVENLYWSMDIHPRWREEGEQFDQLILRPAVFYRLNPKASVWMGYDTIISHPAGNPPIAKIAGGGSFNISSIRLPISPLPVARVWSNATAKVSATKVTGYAR